MRKKEEQLEELVTVKLYRDNHAYRDDVPVIVNGKVWLIKRGVEVELPRYVAYVLKNKEVQRALADRLIDRAEG